MRVACLATSTVLAAVSAVAGPSFEERVEAQRRIDAVYLSHQIGSTRTVAEALPREVLERKVRTYLQQSRLLAQRWNTPITKAMLERELERMARGTRMPERLRELFAALGDDPALIAECLARPLLADRLARGYFAFDERARAAAGEDERTWDAWWPAVAAEIDVAAFEPHDGPAGRLPLPEDLDAPPCLPDDTWDNGGLDLPDARQNHTAVWTGSEMIVWGGAKPFGAVDRGARYDPATDTWALLGNSGAPSPRESHTAVWTGSEMIVWGGGPSATDTGGRYDPQTDTWAPTTTDGAPDGRYEHTAVWTGDEMVVWGGVGGADSGGRYDPSTDTWQPVSQMSAPGPRQQATAVWTGERMIVWGGTWGGTELSTGGVYDPATDTWTPMSLTFAPTGRYDHTAVWTGELMLVWGGNVAGSSPTATGGRYDPANNVWQNTPMALAPQARERHTAIWTGTQMIVWGGRDNSGYFDNGGSYNPQTNAWDGVAGRPPSARAGHTAVWTGDRMLVWGGELGSTVLDTGARYDPSDGTWTPMLLGGVPEGRSGHTTVWTGNRMIVWGGSPYFLPGSRYDPATDSWQPMSSIGEPFPRDEHTAIWSGGEMIVWGGYCCGGKGDFDTGGRYDPLTDAWQGTTTAGAPSGRWGHSAIWTGSEMVVWGGSPAFGPKFNDGARYRPATDSWTAMSAMGAPQARTDHTAVWTGNRMIVWGGETTASANTGGIYDPVSNAWTLTATSGAPSARSGHTALWTGDEMIVWGGANFADELDTGGRFDAQSNGWQPTSTLGAPGQRARHAAVWTGSRMIVWGGFGELPFNCCLDDGAVYDPGADSWAALQADGAPSGRSGHGAVWTGSFMVAWGGLGELRSGGRYALGHADDGDGDGLTECDGDCADGNGGVFAAPGEIQGLTIGQNVFTDALLQWQSDAPNSGSGTRYDVLRGTLGALPDHGAATCLYDSAATTIAGDNQEPAAGDGFYYLIRGQNVCATGGWGESSAGAPREAAACP
jgi:N-acetylneuraminic acid mutarotase